MPDETDVKPAMTARKLSVSDIINRLGQKEVAQELEEKIREGTKQALCNDGVSTVTLTLKIQPDKKGRPGDMSRQLFLDAEVALKTPRMSHSTTVLFMDEEGDLTPDDPKQLLLRGLTGGQ